jgi:methylated-DNA-protein-cysteine methyltransferase-like protein
MQQLLESEGIEVVENQIVNFEIFWEPPVSSNQF